MPFVPGARFEAYEILRPLGSGGMGEVWLATEVRLGRNVALKLLPVEVTRDPARILRFDQEARAASALNHPNVCTIHALGETADGLRYIAMEYVEGETLRHRLATTRLSTREALDIAIQIAAALSAAHAAGIVHRDIKPENVMLRPDGLVKVLDFGLAKLTSSSPDAATTTRMTLKTDAGVVVGTVPYMSPEQARGQEVDARTDIWSLGVLLYELVAGRSPFAASSGTEVLAAILDRDPAPLTRFEPTTPAELQRIVTKSLRKERTQRYQTVQDFLLDLQALRDEVQAQSRSGSSPSTTASSSSDPEVSPPPGFRPRRRVLLGVAVVLAGVLAAIAWGWRHASPSAPVQRTMSRVTLGSGLQTDVTFSPDGRFIAYAADTDGNFDIWVQPVSGGDPVKVTKSPSQDTQPDWSPDGSTIVFRSERDGGGLFVVPALGGPEQRLTSFGIHPHWLANGPEILFIASIVSPDDAGYPGARLKIYVTSIGADRPAEILGDFVERGSWYWVAAHPDGRISLYGQSQRDGIPGFFTVSRDGRNIVISDYATRVPDFLRGEAGRIRRFQWNQSGTALFVEALTGGVRNLWRVDVDQRTLQWRSGERLTTSSSNEVAIALSHDGARLAYTTRSGASRLWAFALDAAGSHLVDAGTPITEEGADVEESDLSRDGRKAAFAMARQGRQGVDLWTTEIETGKRELIAKDAGGPRWSFDGTRLAYFVSDRLVVHDMAGGDRTIGRRVGNLPPPLPTDWTPDGTAVVACWKGSSSIPFALTLWPTSAEAADKPSRILLADPKASLWEGRFSPNGRWLSFNEDSPGRGHIWIAPATGAPRAQWIEIAADHERPDKPRWSADGRTLYFVSRRPTSLLNLWGVRVDPDAGRPLGQPFALTRFDSPRLMISSAIDRTEMSIGPRRAMLTLSSVTGSIWMLDHVDR